MRVHGGNSRTARWRRRRAAVWGHGLASGDRIAAVHLLKRGFALKGIKKLGTTGIAERVTKMNAARQAKRERQRLRFVPGCLCGGCSRARSSLNLAPLKPTPAVREGNIGAQLSAMVSAQSTPGISRPSKCDHSKCPPIAWW